MIFGDRASEAFMQQAEGLIGASGGEAIRGIVENANEPASGAFQAVLGFLILLVSASAVFAQLQAALNRVWRG